MIYSVANLEIAKIVGPTNGGTCWTIFLLLVIIAPSALLLNWSKKVKERNFPGFLKPRRKKLAILISVSICIFLLNTFSVSVIFAPQIIQKPEKIGTFTSKHSVESLEEYSENLYRFIIANLNSFYNRPESAFEIDSQLYNTLLDPLILEAWNMTRSDIILYQGWGSCGQTAIVTQQLLHDAGYTTRLACFKNIDHEWAEVQKSGTWFIVDSGYIGNLVRIDLLKKL